LQYPQLLFSIIHIGSYHIRGEGQIEKVFVLDAHGFIRQKEEHVGRKMLQTSSWKTGDRCSLFLWLTKL